MGGRRSSRRKKRGRSEAEEMTPSRVPTSVSKRVRMSPAPLPPSRREEDPCSQTDDFHYSSQADLATLTSQEQASQQVGSDDEDDVPNPDIIFHPSQAQKIDILDPDADDLNVDEDKTKEHVGNVMRYVLFTNASKRKCLTAKIKEVALGGEVRSKQLFKKIMNDAKAGLEDLFGYGLVPQSFVPEVEKVGQVVIKNGGKPSKKSKKKKKDESKEEEKQLSSGDCWFLTANNISDETKLQLSERRSDNAKRGLLMVVLSMDCAISEKTLFQSLEAVGVDKKNSRNQFEESGSDLVREMISEVYLKKFKSGEVENDGSVSWLYALGAKAYVEIGIMNVLRFVEQTTGTQLTKREKAKLVGLQVSKRT